MSLIAERQRKELSTILQDDNAPVHLANVVTSWIRRNGIKRLDLPAQSLDINPIENLCMVLKKAISERNSGETDVEEEWNIALTSI